MYCKYPFISLHIDPGGKLRPCCRFNGPMSIPRKDINIKDVFYGNEMTSLRDKFMNTSRNEHLDICYRCINEENLDGTSLRMKLDKQESSSKTNLKMLELLFSNICNFSCRGCNSYLSTGWQRDDEMLSKNGFDDRCKTEKHELGKIDLGDINTISYLKITGGEPFLYKNLEYNLNSIAENNRNCDLFLYTNGSIFPPDSTIKAMKKFKDPCVGISVDGIGEVNEYIRYGSNWKIIEENIRKWKETKFPIFLVSVISAYSLPRIHELIEWWGKGRHIFIYLQKPPYIDPSVLSNEVLNISINKLKQHDVSFLAMIKKLKKTDDTRFKLFTKLLDESRGQDYESIR